MNYIIEVALYEGTAVSRKLVFATLTFGRRNRQTLAHIRLELKKKQKQMSSWDGYILLTRVALKEGKILSNYEKPQKHRIKKIFNYIIEVRSYDSLKVCRTLVFAILSFRRRNCQTLAHIQFELKIIKKKSLFSQLIHVHRVWGPSPIQWRVWGGLWKGPPS